MKYLLTFFYVSTWLINQAQSVINVRAFEEDGGVMVLYDLYTLKDETEFYMTIKSSKDGGKVFSPIFDVIGDANKNVKVGSEHKIIWRPPFSPGDSVVFKVEAESKRSIEQMANPNESKIFQHAAGEVSISRVVRINTEVEFIFEIENHRPSNNLFIAARVNFEDNTGHRYDKAVIMQDGKEGAAILCNPTKRARFKMRLANVPQNVTSFNWAGFALSEIPVTFSDVKIEQ